MRHPLLYLLGLVCVMAMALWATPAGNVLTPLANTDQPLATLAIQPAPVPMNITAPLVIYDLFDQTAMFTPATYKVAIVNRNDIASTPDETPAAFSSGANATPVAWRSMPLKVSVVKTLTANLANDSTAMIDNNGITARAAPSDAATLVRNFPNPFNASDTGKTDVALHITDMTPTAMVTVDTAGGRTLCRAVLRSSQTAGLAHYLVAA